MSWRVVNGDALGMLCGLDSESAHSMVTDPPAGISFMGRAWDSNKGGRDHWIAWLCSIMYEAKRVLKPGAYALVWALPRTSHWTAMAIENAGFEIRDVIDHHFGSGFPKSLDVSKAIDKAAGAERKVVGKHKQSIPQISPRGSFGDRFGDEGGNNTITAPATPEAKQWDGWGTALKPATEHWILARKPLSGTVAANVLEHGTGGINVDGCRVGDQERHNPSCSNDGGPAEVLTVGRETVGRWPPNLLLTHSALCTDCDCTPCCPVRIIGEQSGESRSTGGQASLGAFRDGDVFGKGRNEIEKRDPGLGDTGTAARFFPTFRPENTCVLCSMPYITECEKNVTLAEKHSTQGTDNTDTALAPVVRKEQQRDVGNSGLLFSPAVIAENGSGITEEIDAGIAPGNVTTRPGGLHARHVSSAANLCNRCAIAIVQSVAAIAQGQAPESLLGLDFIVEPRRQILTRSLVLLAAGRGQSGITLTTAMLRLWSGYVRDAINTSIILANGADTETDPPRYLYQGKPSTAEREQGVEHKAKSKAGELTGGRKEGSAGLDNPRAGAGRTSKGRANTHPTVKSVALMQWLCRLVTPPGGTVLDCFCGSGSTGVAALRERFSFIGIELDPAFAEIARDRIIGDAPLINRTSEVRT